MEESEEEIKIRTKKKSRPSRPESPKRRGHAAEPPHKKARKSDRAAQIQSHGLTSMEENDAGM